MPAGWGEEERFAAAMEYGATPGYAGTRDDATEDLARELELVALLQSAGPALSPTPAARSRAKERLAAAFAAQHSSAQNPGGHADDTGPVDVIAPVAVAEPPQESVPTGSGQLRHAEPTPLRARHGGRHAVPEPDVADTEAEPAPGVRRLQRRARRSGPPRGNRRAALFGAAAAAALVALAATGTFASQHALPGDPMYGVKRVAESTGYALTFGEQAKARRHLEQAQRRLDEVEGLVTRDQAAGTTGTPADPTEQELVRSTMQEFDTDANEGSRLLLSGAGPDAPQVDDVRQWATEQSARLSGMRGAIAPDKADESLALLGRLLGETGAAGQEPCDPTAGPCPTVTDPAEGATETGPTSLPDGAVPAVPEPRATTRAGDDGDATGDAPTADDEQGSTDRSDDGSSDDRRRDGSGGSGGSSGSGSDDPGSGDVSIPLQLPVKVPSAAPGLPGVSLGG